MQIKTTYNFLFCLGLAAAFPAVYAESVKQFDGGGPETTLDSIWAASGYVHTLKDTVASQINMSRFHDENKYRFWGSGIASFGNASVRNDHPAFDYSAGGCAVGYDYCKMYEGDSGVILGAAVSQMFGHQNIKEMTDHPDGRIPDDRYRQSAFGADIYGVILKELSPRSRLLFSLDFGFGYMQNKCRHRDEQNGMPKWNTDTYLTAFSAAWRYDVTESFSVTPFSKISYTHSANKKKKDDAGYCSYDHDWWDDDDYTCDESHWDNRGKFDNLSLEIGLALEHTIRFSHGKAWINSVSGSYCPDILRNDPHYTFNDTWWEGDTMYQSRYRGKGYSADRQAFKVGGQSRLLLSESLSLFVSYQASLRESYTEQQASLGASISF